jgi:adenylate cyclase
MTLTIETIRSCFEGMIPGTMATCDVDGTPNVSSLSQVQFVDADHVALSYQFFNKTRQNILANPRAMLQVIDPTTGAHYRLSLQYLRTETSGPLFESMKAKLAGVASHVGMANVFRLLGSDVYRVLAVERVPGNALPAPPPRCNPLPALRQSTERLMRCCDLEKLLAELLSCLDVQFGITHAMVLMHDAPRERLYTVASRGYEESGVGSEIPLGEGVIGVAARERTPIRIGHMTAEYAYGRAVRDNLRDSDEADALATEIPLPGLAESRSQMAVPIVAGPRLIGVLYVESPLDLRFSYDDEDALVTLCAQFGLAVSITHALDETPDDVAERAAEPAVEPSPPHADAACAASRDVPVMVRHYPENDSVFLDDDYLIKGVAGSIFVTLLRDHLDKNRTDFTNRELRLDGRIRLPDVSDNLEARLILLGRRLTERDACVRIEKTGRGRFRLCVQRPLKLVDGAGAPA